MYIGLSLCVLGALGASFAKNVSFVYIFRTSLDLLIRDM